MIVVAAGAAVPYGSLVLSVDLDTDPRTLLQQLLNEEGDETSTKAAQQRAVMAALPEDARRALRFMSLMDHAKSGDPMLLMPFDIEVK